MRAQTLLLFAPLLFSAQASAQFYPAPGPGPRRSPPMIATNVSGTPSVGLQMSKIYSDIDEGRRAGQLSRHEAKQLRLQAEEINTLEERYAAGGLSDSEAAELNNRIDALLSAINADRSGYK